MFMTERNPQKQEIIDKTKASRIKLYCGEQNNGKYYIEKALGCLTPN